MIFKIIAIAIISVILSASIKRQNAEIASLISLAGGLMISLLLIDEGKKLIDSFSLLENEISAAETYILPALKILGISYLAELASDLAEDLGNKFLSNKIIMGGKICILALSVNIIKNIINLIMGLVW